MKYVKKVIPFYNTMQKAPTLLIRSVGAFLI